MGIILAKDFFTFSCLHVGGKRTTYVRTKDFEAAKPAFTLANAELDKTFLSEADAAGLLNLKGHRSVGGMRASIYNAVPEAGVDALVDYMQEFERQH